MRQDQRELKRLAWQKRVDAWRIKQGNLRKDKIAKEIIETIKKCTNIISQ